MQKVCDIFGLFGNFNVWKAWCLCLESLGRVIVSRVGDLGVGSLVHVIILTVT